MPNNDPHRYPVSRSDEARLDRADQAILDGLFGRTRRRRRDAAGTGDHGVDGEGRSGVHGANREPTAERLQRLLDERFNTFGPGGTTPGSAVNDYRWPRSSDSAAASDTRGPGEATTRELVETRFPCESCGAALHYEIGTENLRCPYCGHDNAITVEIEPLAELDLHQALRQLERVKAVSPENKVISCPNCAAEFALDAQVHAGECPFCGTHVVTSTGQSRPIKPKGILPFAVTADQARESYRRWLQGLWFAPGELKQYARSDTELNGVYIPYWTYDSDTVTAYQGQRGDIHYVTQRYSTIENGRRVTRTRQVPKIRWRPASGRTSRHFDDVLVGATRTLPRRITDWLAPWDLQDLVPYTEEYLSGFSSEVYQVDLDEGFNIAQARMDKVIRGDVRHAIGGDQQRISHLRTQHSATTFKHVLLPIWSAGFRFRNRSYRFVVNGRTGKVRGERPFSAVKIAFAVLAGAIAAAAVMFFMASSSGMSAGGYGSRYGSNSGGFTIEMPDRGSDDSRSRWPEVPLGDGRVFTMELPEVRF